MTLKELETLMDDTRRISHANDKVLQAQALASIEIARQLVILNQRLNGAGSKAATGSEKKKGGRRK